MADNRENRTVGAGIIVTALLALVLLFMGTALIAYGFCLMAHPADTTDVYWTDVKDNDVLRSDALRVIDPFLTANSPLGKTECWLVSFQDASGDMCIGAMTVAEGDKLTETLDRYAGDQQAALGGFRVQGYFSLDNMDDLGAKFTQAYADACKTYNGVLTTLSGRYYNGNVRETALCFTYICGENENYLAVQGRMDRVSGIIGVVIACAGAAGLALAAGGMIAVRKQRRLNKNDER